MFVSVPNEANVMTHVDHHAPATNMAIAIPYVST